MKALFATRRRGDAGTRRRLPPRVLASPHLRVVIEETFPLNCGIDELEQFMRASKTFATGWMGHFDGQTPEQYAALQNRTVADGLWMAWLRLFEKLGREDRSG